ncbi:serine/threonine protein kinase, partial [Gemmatimonas aurantiaca]|nr:serine/threonine protein kinase [Gemmatimonas aurantiaca]
MITPGQQIAQFKILRQIGAGGMGEVFLAEDTKLGRQVALKVLPEEMNEDPARTARLQREASAAARITHPNVTAIYDFQSHTDEQAGTTFQYIVMEYVEGVSLKEHLVTRKSDIADVLRMAEKIAAGLSAAHKLNIVHRDIKAENII